MHDMTHDTDKPAAAEDNARDRHLFGAGPKRMLALDGGGVRGAITVAFLERIEEILAEEQRKSQGSGQQGTPPGGTAQAGPPSGPDQTPPRAAVRLGDWFDLVGGTSTGAIVATALALGSDTAQIKEFYLKRASRVFKRPFWRVPGLQTKFDARALTDEISAIVEDRRLDSADLITGLAIIAKRMDTGSPWIMANNKKAPYWDDELPTPERRGHIGNKHYKLATMVRASTAAPHYFDPEILAITDNAPDDPLGQVKANLSGLPWLSLLLSKVRAIYGMVSKRGPSADTHGLFVDGGVTPHNNPAMALLTMATFKRLGICWPLGPDNLTIVSIGTGTYRTKVSFGELGWAGPLRLALGALMSVIGDCGNQTLAQMQWLGECMNCWTINSEVRTLCGDAPLGGPWFRFARYDMRLEKPWLSKNLGLTLSDKEIARLQGMDDPGIIETLYGMAREAAKMQVKREHFFPDDDAPPFTCCGGSRPDCPRFIGP
jgi:predicted acylesterase/phospholipase RssA